MNTKADNSSSVATVEVTNTWLIKQRGVRSLLGSLLPSKN